MKKIILIILIITVAKNVSAQLNGVPDTLAYLQTIVANKAQYIGQPFSTLIDNLQIQIKHFIPFASISYDKTKETSTSFSFYVKVQGDYYSLYPLLEIYWQQPLTTQSDVIWTNNGEGGRLRCGSMPMVIRDIQIQE
ncbi:MAG: hypothetical protein IPI98_12300 [Chitinophagaceae bacterium]|nr:hypothetical protein [Chitinophagaceae bacterium]